MLLSPSSHATRRPWDNVAQTATGESPFLLPLFSVSVPCLHADTPHTPLPQKFNIELSGVEGREGSGSALSRLLVWETAMIGRQRCPLIFCVQQAPFGKCLLTARPNGEEMGRNFAIVVCCRFFTLTDEVLCQ